MEGDSMDLIIRNARLLGAPEHAPVDIGVRAGQIIAIETNLLANAPVFDAEGHLCCAGLVETRIHLDTTRIMGRRVPEEGRSADAMAQPAAVRPGFNEADIYRRASRTLEDCIGHGTTRMRARVALDAALELRGLDALEQLRADYARIIDIELCAFPPEGLTDNPRAGELLVAALERGARVIGAAPDRDPDSAGQIRRVFDLARDYDADIDLHMDAGNGAEDPDISLVCELTRQYGRGGRVTLGHGCQHAAFGLQALAHRLRDAGVAVTVLPATGLFMTGCVADANALVEHGVNCAIASGHVLEPRTPYGDGNLIRMANLQANLCRISDADRLRQCFYMITARAAMLMNLRDYGIAVGNPADVVILDAATPEQAVAELCEPLAVFRRGERTVTRARAELHPR
jgi:cytosine deaminase